MSKDVYVLAEQRDGNIQRVSIELIGKATELAADLGQKVVAVLLGSNIKDKADILVKHGADKVIVVDDPMLAEYVTEPYSKALYEVIQKFVINNFGSVISIGSIHEYMFKNENINVDRRTIKKYIEILEKAKIIYSCDLFDIKSKKVLDGEKKYYLADLSIYFALNTDNRINYGPVLENVLYSYLKSKNYTLSVGKIGNLECDFIARRGIDEYFYIQVSKNIDDEKTEKREYKPFYEIKEMYPRYLFVLDLILQKNINGINNVNIVEFILNDEDLR